MRNYRTLFLILGLLIGGLLLFTGCQSDDQTEPKELNLRAITSDEKEIISSSNDFSMNIFARINKDHETENMFISPFSISTALSMTLNGASGNTQQEMIETLSLSGLSESQINDAYKSLVDFLLTLDDDVLLEVANSNWYREDYTINETFKQVLLDYYEAEVIAADFADAGLVDDINGWIANNTHDKIKDMLDQVPADAVMYLINAIYFKADWTYQFDKSKTANKAFYQENGTELQVPTMYCKGVNLQYYDNADYTLYDLPYGNEQFRFTVVMPHTGEDQSLNTLISELSNSELENALANTSEQTIEVYLPKFKIEFKQTLNDVLISMGMEQAFANAQFDRLFEESLNLQISRVIHQSFLEVNEEGSEAAAATIVEIRETSAGPPTVANINRPFAFFIREAHSNTILFAGKLVNPL